MMLFISSLNAYIYTSQLPISRAMKKYVTIALVGMISIVASCDKEEKKTSLEARYCQLEDTSLENPITITGKAIYKRRLFVEKGLGGIDPKNYPIRYAEVRILKENELIGCAETNASGEFTFDIERSNSSYLVEVVARADNSKLKVSVLNTPSDNKYYAVTKVFIADRNKNIGTLIAPANGDVLGGAFNIYDQIFKTNEYLRVSVERCNNECREFTVAPKVTIYWSLGVNPGKYYGNNSGISFYLPGKRELYILGGENNLPNRTDTDHFDDSVIVHEYAHFLQDVYSAIDSPGGAHNGNFIIDPRIAWIEGFANFFSSAVLEDPIYRDTVGNIDGETSYLFYLNQETNASRDIPYDPTPDNREDPTGEGLFREFAIARALWDMIDSNNDNENVRVRFHDLWRVFSGRFRSDEYHYRYFGLFLELYNKLSGVPNIDPILKDNQMVANRDHYAFRYKTNGSCTHTMNPDHVRNGVDGSIIKRDNGEFRLSNQFASNDFFFHQHHGGILSISLEKKTGNSDLDLYVWKERYNYGDSEDTVDFSQGVDNVERIVKNVPAGFYLINVKAHEPNGQVTYTLFVNGRPVCR